MTLKINLFWLWMIWCSLLMMVAFGILSYEAVVYLQTGSWPAWSFIDPLAHLMHMGWAISPHDWLGVHALFERTPLAPGIFVPSFALAYATRHVFDM